MIFNKSNFHEWHVSINQLEYTIPSPKQPTTRSDQVTEKTLFAIRNMSPILLHMNSTLFIRPSLSTRHLPIRIPVRAALSRASPGTSLFVGGAHVQRAALLALALVFLLRGLELALGIRVVRIPGRRVLCDLAVCAGLGDFRPFGGEGVAVVDVGWIVFSELCGHPEGPG